MEKVTFLGHVLSAEGITVDLSKVESVTKWEQPLNVTVARSFLGMAGYYRRFLRKLLQDCKADDRVAQEQHKFRVVRSV
jgi:hypothetical protein